MEVLCRLNTQKQHVGTSYGSLFIDCRSVCTFTTWAMYVTWIENDCAFVLFIVCTSFKAALVQLL